MNDGAWNSTFTLAVVVTFVVTFVPCGVMSVLVTTVGLLVPLSTPLDTEEGVGLGLIPSSSGILRDEDDVSELLELVAVETRPLAVFVIVVV